MEILSPRLNNDQNPQETHENGRKPTKPNFFTKYKVAKYCYHQWHSKKDSYRRSDWKKAYIRLAEGQDIDFSVAV